jgi:hypothetical protein
MFAQNGAGLNETATTKVLAIGSIITPLTLEERSAILPKEVRETVKLYLQGRIDQWWFRQDDKGVVFLLNVSSINAASAMLEKLPLGLAKRMKFEFIQVGPLKPLQYLLNDE